ncbi:MAG TPA: multiheme c-type cytochrome [Puia sp.]|nr:multiheme c-type cytochrome [Puia sp.]
MKAHCPRSVLVISGMLLGICLFIYCVDKHPSKTQSISSGAPPEPFAGSLACAGCHKNIYDTHIHTAHYLTSQEASLKNIKGSFEFGENRFVFSDYTYVAMEKRKNGLYQVEYNDGAEKKARRFDITVGSGTKGQTYLYWWKDTLFQLPISWFTDAGKWSNSPGYYRVAFGRPITSRCLECHSTYVRVTSPPNARVDEYDHNIVFGVDCEKCHGPGLQHVRFQGEHPEEKTGKFIINPATFTRQQQLDLCMLCHGGRLEKTSPSFTFQSGDTLANYFALDTAQQNAADIDVHGNQYGLLAASKCFRMSQMTCNTCHNTHINEAGKPALFSQRCITCHQEHSSNFCKLSTLSTARLKQNCIDCHMPQQPSQAIMMQLEGETAPTSAYMRTHFIKVYPDETKKFLQSVKKSK